MFLRRPCKILSCPGQQIVVLLSGAMTGVQPKVQYFSDEDLKMIRNMFNFLDTDRDNKINARQVKPSKIDNILL